MLTLTDPLIETTAKHSIYSFTADMVANNLAITVAYVSDGDVVHKIQTKTMPIYSDVGTILMPSVWPEGSPTGPEIYQLLQAYLYGRMQDMPGENGVGLGVIT
jgi:hypothetical protein